MKKITLFLYLLFCSSLLCPAQNPEDAILQNPLKASGTYYVYDSGGLKPLTPAPEGYKPVYISHFGRHGARYCTSEYDAMYEWLSKAGKARILTETGKRFFSEYDAFYQKAKFCKGNLTNIGKEQHRGISTRIFKRFPEVFEGPTHIVASSTESPRVIMSMWSFISGLQSLDGDISIDADASARFAPWLQPVLSSNPYLVKERTRADKATREKLEKYTEDNLPAEEITLRLFTDMESFSLVLKTTPEAFVKVLHGIVTGTRCLDADRGLFDWVVSREELYSMWKVSSAGYFAGSGNLEGSGNLLVDYAAFTMENVIECADADMTSGDTRLRLRFGHDASLMPFITFLGMNGVGRSTSSLEESLNIFPNYLVPMGCSVQLVFYKNAENKVIVKALLNEEEATLPIQAVEGPYYDWDEVKAYYLPRIAESRSKIDAALKEASENARVPAVQPREKSVAAFREANWNWKPVAGTYVESGSAMVEVFGGMQTVSLVRFPMNKQAVSILESDGASSAVVSELGKRSGALAAINGGFFDREHMPVSFVKDEGKVVSSKAHNSEGQGLFLIKGKKGRKVDIVSVGSKSMEEHAKGWREAIATGPVLMENGVCLSFEGTSKRLADRRHPRTAVGYTDDGWVYLIVVDGRFPYRAEGMSLPELQILCEALGLYEAINLDGGGSASMWTVDDGIISHPYDNKVYDHGGERVIPNAIIVK